MKPIVQIPNTVLFTQAKTITSFDKKLQLMIKDMKETLLHAKNPKGVGLAGPQIGLPYRIFITKPTEKSDIRVFINPEIITASPLKETDKDHHTSLEGCLSIPRIWGHVKRSESVTLRYQDETGQSHEESFTGFMATIVQHETDHTNGMLFTMRIIEQQGVLYQVTKGNDGKDVFEEVELR